MTLVNIANLWKKQYRPTNRWLVLQEELKEKDQSIRKSEQELESLLFRNEQLSKRIVVLQEDLQKAGQATKKRLAFQSCPLAFCLILPYSLQLPLPPSLFLSLRVFQ